MARCTKHVVRAQPATEAAHIAKLVSAQNALIQQHKDEVQALHSKFAAQQQAWQVEKKEATAQHEAFVKSMAAQLEGVVAKRAKHPCYIGLDRISIAKPQAIDSRVALRN
jgi:hypothetical protein